jgi:hypothetical protein
MYNIPSDRLCGLVVRVSGNRSRGPGFDSRPYYIFWKVGSLGRGPLSLVRPTEELLERKSSGSGLENRDYNGRGNSLRWPRNTLYPQRLALTSPTSGGRSVGIVRLRTTATEIIITFLRAITAHQTPTFTEWLQQLCCCSCTRLWHSSPLS